VTVNNLQLNVLQGQTNGILATGEIVVLNVAGLNVGGILTPIPVSFAALLGALDITLPAA